MSEAKQELDRRSYLGCSELAAVMGLDTFKTPLDVYNEKLGLVEPFAGNRHTTRGTKLEAVAAMEYTERTGRSLRRRKEALVHARYEFLRGHIDRLVVGEDRIAEVKCPSRSSFAKVRREGLPTSWIVQMQGYLLLSGKGGGEFIVFCADEWDLISFDVQAERELFPKIEEAAADFWSHVIDRNPPKAIDADKPKIEFAKVAGEVVQRNDQEFLEAAELLREADRLKRDGTELYELAKDRIKAAIGGRFGKYEGGGLRLHYSTQAGRVSFDKKALERAHPEIDLNPFNKQGEPFEVFRPYFLQGGE